MIQNISIDKLFPHPNNPRRDLGDLTELAESIKARGVMQNLTVIPSDMKWWDCLRDDSKENYLGNYTVVIGHRRRAAAELAGLTELPCSIVEMSERDQVATMLLENIQRADLTVIEQAEGFQLMLDLGETVTGISEKTGFSESTVRHRVKLNELDKKKLAEASMRGGTLQDYISLEKIENPKTRNELLEKIGTTDFNWQLTAALKKQDYPRLRKALIEFLDGWAKPTKESEYSAGLDRVHCFYGYQLEGFKKPKDADKVKYVYVDGGSSITLCKKSQKAAPKKKTDAEKSFDERKATIEEISKQAYELRYAFVKNFSAVKRYAISIHVFAMRKLLRYGGADPEKMLSILDMPKPEDRQGEDYSAKWHRVRESILVAYADAPEKLMLMAAYIGFGDCPSYCYYSARSWESKIVYQKHNELDIIYDALIELGYELSTEEQQLRDGTHELFDKPKPKDEPTPTHEASDPDEDDEDEEEDNPE